MPRADKDLVVRAEQILSAWQSMCPTKTFASLTLDQFRQALKPSQEIRALLVELASKTNIALKRRIHLDIQFRPTVLGVVHSVRGDPGLGEDSAVYEAMGYVRKRVRRKRRKKRKASAK